MKNLLNEPKANSSFFLTHAIVYLSAVICVDGLQYQKNIDDHFLPLQTGLSLSIPHITVIYNFQYYFNGNLSNTRNSR